MTTPETRYAKSGDVSIAYQVVGRGPFDLVYVPGFVSNIELMWEEPGYARFLERLATFSRLVVFDKRGTGLSDAVTVEALPTLEQRMDDVRAVMDAVGSDRAALLGHSEGGNMCALFAATYPERTRALVLVGCYAKRIRSDDYPWAPAFVDRMRHIEETERTWGWADRSARARAQQGRRRPLRSMDVPVLATVREPEGRGRVAEDELDDRRSFGPAGDPGPGAAPVPGQRLRRQRRGGTLHRVADPERDVRRAPGRRSPHVDRRLGGDARRDRGVPHGRSSRPRSRPRADDGPVHRRGRVDRDGDATGRPRVARAPRTAPWRGPQGARALAGREVDTAGDGFLATFDGPARAIRCAVEATRGVRELGLEIRAGVHTGEVELAGDDVRGIAVHIGSRVSALAAPNEVHVAAVRCGGGVSPPAPSVRRVR